MAWLKLTKQGLYLMKGDSDCFLKKADVQAGLSSSELRVMIPLDWFSGRDVPGGMVIDLESAEPSVCPTIPIRTSTLSGKKIVLDPGHGEIFGGFNDPGALGPNGRTERDEVRKQATVIKNTLEQKGASVTIIENDTSKTLGQIGAEGAGADCFVSLHLNAFNSSAQGHEVFVHTLGTPTDVELATFINQELDREFTITNRGVKRAGLGVLIGVPLPVPAVLTEAFFIDAVDVATLDNMNPRAANAIARGIERFLTT